MKRKFKNVDEVISPTEFLKGFYEERGFFNRADFKTEFAGEDRNLSVHRKSVSKKPKFLFVGSLVPHKGLNILMQAWDEVCHFERSEESLGLMAVKNDFPSSLLNQNDISLHIVGDGIMKEEINKWAKNKKSVFVHGRLEGEKLEEIFKNSDILFFSSTCIENNPTVIHEAIHYGLGVIATDTGGVREILDRDNSWLYIPDDVEDLVNKIKRFV